MISPRPGERLSVNGNPGCRIRIRGSHVERLGLAAVDSNGRVRAFEKSPDGSWYLSSLAPAENASADYAFDIIAYMTDDRLGGFVNSSYPIEVEIAGDTYNFPLPADSLAAVILAEVYTRNGSRKLKVSNEGFAFGIDAYARARNLQGVNMPLRSRENPAPGDHAPRPSPGLGEALASGSGVIVAPGLVVTNAHVIEDGNRFYLGRTRQALLPVAVDVMHDLALLKGEVGGTPLPLRVGLPLWLGEGIMAAGYPLMDVLGADLKVTTGNISGLSGGTGDISRFQFTAPIGSGSSGGAIIDEAGNLVGITSASLAHGNMRERGSISENVNFGVRAGLVFEMIAAAGLQPPTASLLSDTNRRDVVNRLRDSVVSIIVAA